MVLFMNLRTPFDKNCRIPSMRPERIIPHKRARESREHTLARLIRTAFLKKPF